MTDLKTGRTWSDERHKVRVELRAVIDWIVEAGQSDALSNEDIVQVILETAVGYHAWGGEPDDVACRIERLAQRVRNGERFEL
ncbi:hypothetical protein MKK70_27260 [Methylobacterium sp. E-041]|uniref:hypothetical protein n=1 Tax=Methylobacterium sp. E-041 TaxID=2836573 RepID=UPI001FB89F04|nr:hypothetical protein [Methylobacterium sp. E-041]MCJ2109000.1 hypothetical protein [Methylobacterium sp. E-041]